MSLYEETSNDQVLSVSRSLGEIVRLTRKECQMLSLHERKNVGLGSSKQN